MANIEIPIQLKQKVGEDTIIYNPITRWENIQQAPDFDNHVNNKSNPHAITASQINAEPVRTLVTQLEAESGTSTDIRSWSPLRVKQAVVQSASFGGQWVEIQRYTTPGTYSFVLPARYGAGVAYEIGFILIGGGGSGGVAVYCNEYSGTTNQHAAVSGGASGRATSYFDYLAPGVTWSVIIGAGGAAVSKTPTGSWTETLQGNAGGTSTVGVITALGGEGGQAYSYNYDCLVRGANGGQGSDSIYSAKKPIFNAPRYGRMTEITRTNNAFGECYPGITHPLECYNPFTGYLMLGAGGGASGSGLWSGSILMYAQIADAQTGGFKGGNGATATNANATATAGTGIGNGGGAAVVHKSVSASRTATSGAGANGGAIFYARRRAT